jgi:hypothetical protein
VHPPLTKKGLEMRNYAEQPVRVTDENTGKTWYAVTWQGLDYRFDSYHEAFKFYAELRFEVLYGALKPQVSFLD